MNLKLAFGLMALAPMALAQPIVHTGSTFPPLDNLMTQAMQRYGIPGGALSISYQGKLVHAAGYGYGDIEGGVPVQPNSMLRVHSISKAFLMWALFGAVDEGKFQFTDKAFALLGPSFTPPPGVPPCAPVPVAPCVDPRLSDITVQQLFDHQGGWDPDPIESSLQSAAAAFAVPSPPSADILIRYVMGQPLNYTPGSRTAYAGIDYVILARIIERKAANPGETFPEYFRRKFMLPLRASRTNLASSTLSGRAPWEVKQYVDTNDIGTGLKGPSKWDAFPGLRPVQYEGGAAMAAADAAGGFGSTMPELTRLITAMLGDLGPSLNPLPNYSPYVAHGASTGWLGGWWGSVSEWISFPAANGQVTASFSFNTADYGRPIPNDASSWNPLGEVDAGIRAFAASNPSWPQVDLFPQYLGPVLTSLSTSTSPVRGSSGFTLTLSGTNFDPATSTLRLMGGGCYDPTAAVQLGCRVPVNQPQSTPTSVSAFMSGLSAGTYTLTVFNSSGPDSNGLALAVLPAAPGDLDPLDLSLAGSVYTMAVQPDGKTIIAGSFSSVLGQPRNNVARLNADGTLDTGFDPNADSLVSTVAVQADGKVLLGGEFTTLQPSGAPSPILRNYIARVNPDGTLDMGFNPNANDIVNSVAVQADGKVVLGGLFTALQPNGAPSPTSRGYIARVNANGTLDTGFDPSANDQVLTLAVQADGKILLGGWFTALQPNGAAAAVTRNFVARVDENGALDPGFDPNPDLIVGSVAVQADSKVLLGGLFTALQPNGAASPTARSAIARLNPDGSLDQGFDPRANLEVASVAVQADGKVLLAGEFTTLQPNGAASPTSRNHIARVNADGTLDTSFDPNANGYVGGVAVRADGKVLLGGQFTTLQPGGAASPISRNRFALLLNDPATQTLTAPSSTQVSWTRGGSSPELSRVTFEVSTNLGATWTALGNAVRVGSTPDWQVTGLSLPPSGQLRARGVTSGGYLNSSSGLIEAVVSFAFSTNADLSALSLSTGTLTPSFLAETTAYTAGVASGDSTLNVTPTKAQPDATIAVRVNGASYVAVASGSPSSALALNVGPNTVDVRVTAQDGTTIKIYTVTVTRAGSVPSVSISDVTLAEGNAGPTNAVFNVTLSASSLQTIAVSAVTSDLSANAGSDYTASGPTTITFAPGITVQTFSVPIVGDTVAEPNETFQVTLSAPVNVTILDGIGIGTLTNDDGTPPSRVFVSSSGSDVNVCSTQTTPCRNLAAAIAQVAVDGEVIVLTPGEYESAPLLIAKGVKITSPSGTVAFVRQPVTVNAAGGRVVLRGLTLKGAGSGNAVTLVSADTLSVEDSTLDGWSVGLQIGNAAAAQVIVSNSVFRASVFGISDLGGAPSNRVSVGESRFEGNGTGIDIRSGSFLVRESTFAGNSGSGVAVGPGSLDIQRSELSFNGVGVNAASSGSVRISRSRVFGNTTGLIAGAGSTFLSSGGNVVRLNGTNTTGTITAVPEQ